MTYVDLFSGLGFDFNVDLEPKAIDIEKDAVLTQKLKNSVFFYKSPTNTNTSFYLITSTLEQLELDELRKYIWNKNDGDVIFYHPNKAETVEMLYGKFSPKVAYNKSILRIFSTNQKDLDKLDEIKKWQFDSGAFWLNYQKFFEKSKFKGIDKELVGVLEALKKHLSQLLSPLTASEDERDVVVQALIDRTLYIKYLEDRHIINSFFYKKYFQNSELNYQKLLENNDKKGINTLFEEIQNIFNNSLFETPEIDEQFLTVEVCTAIASSFNHSIDSPQLNLFDFRFDVLPVEFISYIYEVFLSDKQKANGIFYTPKKLAQLITDDVIPDGSNIGSILDPSCGSGMFLIVGFKRLLEIARIQELEPDNSIDKIKFRLQLLCDNIFGIEKQITAQRFTLFSLSLQVFDGINAEEIKNYIAAELKQKGEISLFKKFDFHRNIKHANTLDIFDKPFDGQVFSYIVGNPPFVGKEVSEDAKKFKDNYTLNIFKERIIAKDLVDGCQISQCFLLKIIEWSNEQTRFGFVSNSSNFYNEAVGFQKFFYSRYKIEKIYELSRVKKILFEEAKESVVAIVFTNNFDYQIFDNILDYYPVELGLFSEKPFELLIIQEDKVIKIEQAKLFNRELKLRDFLVGNDFDRVLTGKMSLNTPMSRYINPVRRGFEIWGKDARKKEFNISNQDWKKITSIDKINYLNKFIEAYFSHTQSSNYDKSYIKPSNLKPFVKIPSNQFISNIDNFHRPRVDRGIYFGDKLMFTRIGSSLNCVYSKGPDYFDFSVYTIKLKDANLYYLFVALLNSYVVRFYLDFYLRKRMFDSFSRIGNKDILNIPIPSELDATLVKQISTLSQDLTNGKYAYSEKEEEINDLIYDLYELSYWEKQRVKDYFLPKEKIGRKRNALNNYTSTLKEIVGFYFKNPIKIEEASVGFNLIVVKLSFDDNSNNPTVDNTKLFSLNEIFEQNPNTNFLASQEKIFGEDCVYIIKDDRNTNWTETKAFEDGQDIVKRLIPNAND
jgi:hypothetical protein